MTAEGQVGGTSFRVGRRNGVILISTGSVSWVLKRNIEDNLKYPAFGLFQLQAFLRMHGYYTLICDLVSETWTRTSLSEHMLEFDASPLAVGISAYTENLNLVPQLTSLIRDLYPGVPIIIGGPHVSFLPEDGLAVGADFVVRFEGEFALIELLEHIKYPGSVDKSSIRSISYRGDDGRVISTRRRPLLKVLDWLPFSEALLEWGGRTGTLYLLSSLGCPGKCVFCASVAYSGRRLREHSAEWLWSVLYCFGRKYPKIRHVDFIDDTFTVNRHRLERLFDLIRRGGERIVWEARSRVDGLDSPYIEFLSRNGCISLHLGIESAQQSVLDAIRKNFLIENLYDVLAHLLKCGIRPRCSFIIGHHADTLAGIEATLFLASELIRHRIGTVAVSISTPFPGTPLFKHADRFGIVITARRWSDYTTRKPVYHTKHFSTSDIQKALYQFHVSCHSAREEGWPSGGRNLGYSEHIRAAVARLYSAIPGDSGSPTSEGYSAG